MSACAAGGGQANEEWYGGVWGVGEGETSCPCPKTSARVK